MDITIPSSPVAARRPTPEPWPAAGASPQGSSDPSERPEMGDDDARARLPLGVSFNYNPKGLLPGAGPRELRVQFERTPDGRLEFKSARSYVGQPWEDLVSRGVKWTRADYDEHPGLGALADAVAGAYEQAATSLVHGPSHEPNIDNGYGWMLNRSYQLTVGNKTFYGRFKQHERNLPAVQPLAEALGKFGTLLRKDVAPEFPW